MEQFGGVGPMCDDCDCAADRVCACTHQIVNYGGTVPMICFAPAGAATGKDDFEERLTAAGAVSYTTCGRDYQCHALCYAVYHNGLFEKYQCVQDPQQSQFDPLHELEDDWEYL